MEQKNFGLVLAGGGGKGSYQIGVWKALRHLRMDTWVKAISGDSIGALNAVLFANGDYDTAERVWKSISPTQFMDLSTKGTCSRDALVKLLHEELDLTVVSNSSIQTYATIAKAKPFAPSEDFEASIRAIFAEEHEGEYRLLNGLPPEEIVQVLLASTALPIIYEPVKLGDSYYRDGGLFDNMPMRPLLEAGVRDLILVKLKAESEYDIYLSSQADTLIEISPSTSLGGFVDGTLDFDGENAEFRMQLGFYDTLRAFEFYERRIMGFPATPVEKAHRIQQDIENATTAARAAKAISSIDRNMDMLNSIYKKYDI